MTLGGSLAPGTGDRASPGLPLPVLMLGSESSYPECPEFMGSWKVNISTDLFSFHPNGYHFWKRDIIIRGCSSIHAVKAKRDGKFQSFWFVVPHLTHRCLWCWGPRENSGTCGRPASPVVRWAARARGHASGPCLEGAAWGHPGLA